MPLASAECRFANRQFSQLILVRRREHTGGRAVGEQRAFLEFEHAEMQGVSQYYCVGLNHPVVEEDLVPVREVRWIPPAFCQCAEVLQQAPLPGWNSDPSPSYIPSLNIGSGGVTNLFYLAFLWRLTDGLSRFVTFNGYGPEDLEGFSLPISGESVRWEYLLWASWEDYWWYSGQTHINVDFHGFSRRDGNGAEDRPCTLFPVASFRELLKLQTYGLSSAFCEMVLYAVGRDQHTALLDSLRDQSSPTLQRVVGQQGLLIDYVCGNDLGYWHAMQISSNRQLEGTLRELNDELLRAAEAYSDSVHLIEPTSYEEFVLGILRV